MIVYSGTKSQFPDDAMSNGSGNTIYNTFNGAACGAWQHEDIVLKPLNPAYADIVIPNAEAEDFMVVAEVVDNF